MLKEISLNYILLPNEPTDRGKTLDLVLPALAWRTRVSLVDGNVCTVSPSLLSIVPEKTPEMLSYKGLNLANLRSRFPKVLVGDPSLKPIPLAPAEIDSDEESEVETTVGPVSTISQEEDNTAFLVEV